MRVASDGGIARTYALGGVDDQQRHVRGLKMPPRHHHAHLFRHQSRLALAADSCGIDEAQRVALELHHLVDGVARGAGDRRHDGARGPRERIKQRALAHVRPPDDGHRRFALLKFSVSADLFLVLDRLCTRNERSAFFNLVLDRLIGLFGCLRTIGFIAGLLAR